MGKDEVTHPVPLSITTTGRLLICMYFVCDVVNYIKSTCKDVLSKNMSETNEM